jgi:two-component system, OmpR family, response regulator
MKNNYKIFLVEDDNNFGRVLKSYLEVQGFSVFLFEDGPKAISNFHTNGYDICILDVMLPNMDGYSIAREIRLLNETIPLFFLTAKIMKEDVMKGYLVGADDYITKPFDSEVLICKIKAILKRHCAQKENIKQEEYIIGKYFFNSRFRTLQYANNIRKLSPKETLLLHLLCNNINNITSRETTLKTIWGDDNYFTTRSMDVFITKLRKYLKNDPNVDISNINRYGYILSVKE